MLSALSLARSIEAGETTPAQVIDLCAEAIALREKDIGALVTLDLDGARWTAKARPLKDTPLRGLPFGLKDIFDTADMPTEHGSASYIGYRPKHDAALVSMIRRNGGTLLAKTVTTEFAHTDPGKTRNPHNLDHTPGGSSSGSAAGVAAGFFPIATGSQTGGSIVRPAGYCGVAGFKPSYRLLPTVGMKCVSWHLDTAGLFAASIADVAFAAAAVSGRDLRVDGKAPSAPRIGVLRDAPWPAASADMMTAIDRVASLASAKGAKVSDVRLPATLEAAFKAHSIILAYEAAQSLGSEYERAKDQLGPGIRELVERGFATTPVAYDEARRISSRSRRSLDELYENADVILSPSAPGSAPKGFTTTGNSTFNRLWTLMGTPCVNIPGLVDAGGLPLGIQVIGPFGRDRETLEAALFVESLISKK